MSLLTNNTQSAPGVFFFLRNPVPYLSIAPSNSDVPISQAGQVIITNVGGNMYVNGSAVGQPSNWSLYPAISNTIKMDASNTITNSGNNLYYNGSLLANASDIQNIADWSLYVALCNIDMNSKSISNSTGYSGSGNVTTSGNVSGATGTFPSITTNLINTPSSNHTLNISNANLTGDVAASMLNIANTGVITAVDVRPEVNIKSEGGLQGGKVSLVANGSTYGLPTAFGGLVEITANPQTTFGLDYNVTVGGKVNITANSGVGIDVATSSISLNAAGINSYAGVGTPLGSLAGYNYVVATNSVNIVSGLFTGTLPSYPGYNYLYGQFGTRISNYLFTDYIQPIGSLTGLVISGNVTQNITMCNANLISMYLGATATSNGRISNIGVADFSSGGIGNNGIIQNVLTINGTAPSSWLTSLAGWSGQVASSTLNMCNNNITNCGTINGVQITSIATSNWASFSAVSNVNMNSKAISNVTTINGVAPGSWITSTAGWSGNVATSDVNMCNFSIVNCCNVSLSNINGNLISTYANVNWASNVAVANVNMCNYSLLNVSNINGINPATWITSPSNWSSYPALANVNFAGYTLSNVNDIESGATSNLVVRANQSSINVYAISFGNTITMAAGSNGGAFTIGQTCNAINTYSNTFEMQGAGVNVQTNLNMSNHSVSNVTGFTRILGSTAVAQPVIQYGTATGSGSSGSVTVTIPTAYTSSSTYVVQVTMRDSPTAQLYATPTASNTFTIGWSSAGAGTQNIMWTTFGT